MAESEDSTKPGSRSATPRRESGEEHRAAHDVSVTKLKMPVSMVVSIIVMAVSISGTWWRMSAHADSRVIHLDEHEVIQGGGVAFKNDLRNAREDSERRLRRMLSAIVVRCRFISDSRGSKVGDSECTLQVPEVE